jgi:S1-C subfamily serine protease
VGLEALPADQFTTDISTSGGTAGGPLVDLMTGQVIGVQVAGLWRGERGKFAYSKPISPDLVAAIAARRKPAPAPPAR